MSLYSAETVADTPNDTVMLQRSLDRTRLDFGLQLHPKQLSLPGDELKMMRILRYERTSIAQIDWLHADYGALYLACAALYEPNCQRTAPRHAAGMEDSQWSDWPQPIGPTGCHS